MLENCRLFGMLRARTDEDHLILHAFYKTVGSTFAQECSFEVAGIVLVAGGVRVVDGGNEVANIADALFHDTAELHSTRVVGQPPAINLLTILRAKSRIRPAAAIISSTRRKSSPRRGKPSDAEFLMVPKYIRWVRGRKISISLIDARQSGRSVR